MAQPTNLLVSDQAAALELLFHLYLFGRKIKHQAKQGHPDHIHDQMLEFGMLKLMVETPRSVSELAELLSTGLSAMSERIKTLKDRGLVDQVSGRDAREMRSQLTQAGQELVAQTKAKMIKTCLQFTKVLSNDEINQLTSLMKKLVLTPQPEETELQ